MTDIIDKISGYRENGTSVLNPVTSPTAKGGWINLISMVVLVSLQHMTDIIDKISGYRENGTSVLNPATSPTAKGGWINLNPW